MDFNYSIIECSNCGSYKLISNDISLKSKEASCTCDNESILIYGIVKNNLISFSKTER